VLSIYSWFIGVQPNPIGFAFIEESAPESPRFMLGFILPSYEPIH
jgi:hypothetical protein